MTPLMPTTDISTFRAIDRTFGMNAEEQGLTRSAGQRLDLLQMSFRQLMIVNAVIAFGSHHFAQVQKAKPLRTMLQRAESETYPSSTLIALDQIADNKGVWYAHIPATFSNTRNMIVDELDSHERSLENATRAEGLQRIIHRFTRSIRNIRMQFSADEIPALEGRYSQENVDNILFDAYTRLLEFQFKELQYSDKDAETRLWQFHETLNHVRTHYTDRDLSAMNTLYSDENIDKRSFEARRSELYHWKSQLTVFPTSIANSDPMMMLHLKVPRIYELHADEDLSFLYRDFDPARLRKIREQAEAEAADAL